MNAWDAEYAPPNLVSIANAVRGHYALPWSAIGMKGDASHTYGYHRSRNWVNTLGGKSGDYSVQLDLDRSGGGEDWVSALDVSLDTARLKVATTRVMAALQRKDPAVSDVREVFGTTDGKTVTGWDAAKNRLTTSDASHLFHLHVSFYRSKADVDHSGLLRVLSTDGGSGMELNTRVGSVSEPNFDRTVENVFSDLWHAIHGPSQDAFARIKAIQAAVDGLDAGGSGGVDVDALAEKVVDLIVPQLRQVVADELAKLRITTG